MINSDAAAGRTNRSDRWIALVAVLLSLLVGGISVSDQSLWIDEAHSAFKAMQPSLGSWWATMVAEKGSDLQMPLYMLYLWAWVKAFGASEIALRAANLPWLVAAVLTLIWAFPRKPPLQCSIAVLTLGNAFLWYYVSEARPYVVLFAFSALTAACLFRLRQDPEASIESSSWFRWFALGIVGICATNLIAVPWAMGAIAAFGFLVGTRKAVGTLTRSPWTSALVLTALVGLCLYYVWSLRLGARASNVSRTGLATLGVVFYELLGLSGLGPGRLSLREEGVRALVSYAPAVSVGLVAVFILFISAISGLRHKATRSDFIFFGISAAGPAAILVLAGFAIHLRLLGRHFTPLLPFLLALEGIGFQRLFFAAHRSIRAVAFVASIALLISALEIRFAPRHRRDDYRSAANLARAAIGAGEKVWWLADETAGAYYNLPLHSVNLTLSSGLTNNLIQGLPAPDLVCLSKPDIYDPDEKIRNYLRDHDFKATRLLPAFQILKRSPDHR